MTSTGSDIEKLQVAVQQLLKLTSLEAVLESFGLKSLPTAQRYGIFFGCLTFVLTVTSVLILLVLGGSFQRIKEQEETGGATVPDAVTARSNRPLLLERLLEARERMMKSYPEHRMSPSEKKNPLMKMLELAHIDFDVSSNESKQENDKQNQLKDNLLKAKNIPPGYKENYIIAYRQCQNKPGGPILPGLPECRFEAYARAYAACGTDTKLTYRRSYARIYEAMVCKNEASEKKYADLYHSRPMDIVGRSVRLEPIDSSRHAASLHDITSGDAYAEHKSYNPNLLWGFLDYGPFQNVPQLVASPIFQLQCNEAVFAIIENLTDRILGVIRLTNDDPKNLSIEMEHPIVKPPSQGTVEQIESCFLLLDKLFALGYRRVQLSIDSQDAVSRKLPGRLGFTQEGHLIKHRIIKDASRDSFIYSMLNSDWDKGARSLLFKKLHGVKAQQYDEANNLQESEKDEQNRVLAEQAKKLN